MRNNIFFKHMHDKALDIFGPTIQTRWNAHNTSLKKNLTDHLVSQFGDSFNKIGVTSLAGTYLKYGRDQYRVHLQTKPRYENPPIQVRACKQGVGSSFQLVLDNLEVGSSSGCNHQDIY
jgi:hypothetical protein